MPPPPMTTELAITFLYYRDLAAATDFYEEVMGFVLAIDQGWSRIYRICEGAHLGLVDEARGMHRAAEHEAGAAVPAGLRRGCLVRLCL